MLFEENRGQYDGRALYTTFQPGMGVFFERDGVTFALGSGAERSALRLTILDANHSAKIQAEGATGSVANYLTGLNSKNWKTGVPQFKRVVARDIKPATDLIFYGAGHDLEYDLVFRPGAKPEELRLRYEGSEGLTIDRDGDLTIHTKLGDLKQHKPAVWQELNGEKVRIKAGYWLLKDGAIGIDLGDYDRARELVVDPVVSLATYLGGSRQDSISDVAVDASGNIVVCGATSFSDFPTTIGSYRASSNSPNGNAFVSKLNASGTALLFSTFLGGSAPGGANALALDSSANVYVTGTTFATDFPFTSGAYSSQLGKFGSPTIFVAKLNAAGNALLFSTSLGQTFVSYPRRIAITTNGESYVAGQTKGFPVTPGSYSTALDLGTGSNYDVFVAKLSSAGDMLVYGTYLGGSADDYIGGLAVDAKGQACVAGSTSSSDFPVSAQAFQKTSSVNLSTFTGFIVCLNANATAPVFSTYLGGSGYSGVSVLTLDAAGNLYVSGSTSSADFPTTPGAYSTTVGLGKIFVSKMNSAGTALLFSTFISPGSITAIAVDSGGSPIVAGSDAVGFPVTTGAIAVNSGGPFLVKLSPTGSAVTYGTSLGSQIGSNQVYGLALDNAGNPVIAGTTTSISMPVTANALQPRNLTVYTANGTGFVEKIDLTSNVICTVSLSTSLITAPPGGGTGTIAVTAPSGCPWEGAASNFVTVNHASGVGSGVLTYTVQPNDNGGPYSAARTTYMGISGSAVTVNQPLCTYSLSSTSLQIPGSGGSIIISESAPSGCTWYHCCPKQA